MLIYTVKTIRLFDREIKVEVVSSVNFEHIQYRNEGFEKILNSLLSDEQKSLIIKEITNILENDVFSEGIINDVLIDLGLDSCLNPKNIDMSKSTRLMKTMCMQKRIDNLYRDLSLKVLKVIRNIKITEN